MSYSNKSNVSGGFKSGIPIRLGGVTNNTLSMPPTNTNPAIILASFGNLKPDTSNEQKYKSGTNDERFSDVGGFIPLGLSYKKSFVTIDHIDAGTILYTSEHLLPDMTGEMTVNTTRPNEQYNKNHGGFTHTVRPRSFI
jgi:hypothetical protein